MMNPAHERALSMVKKELAYMIVRKASSDYLCEGNHEGPGM